jgi:hypothetical protein
VPSPQKNKGSSWERKAAQELSKLYGETFIRAPGSGAYVGGTNNSRKAFLHEGQVRSFKGDIVPGESFPRFNAECKSYKEFPFHQLLSNKCTVLDTWISQLLDAADAGDFNILIMKFNRKGQYICIESKHNPIAPSYVEYNSALHGSWRFIEYHTFWQYNANLVKTLCK